MATHLISISIATKTLEANEFTVRKLMSHFTLLAANQMFSKHLVIPLSNKTVRTLEFITNFFILLIILNSDRLFRHLRDKFKELILFGGNLKI